MAGIELRSAFSEGDFQRIFGEIAPNTPGILAGVVRAVASVTQYISPIPVLPLLTEKQCREKILDPVVNHYATQSGLKDQDLVNFSIAFRARLNEKVNEFFVLFPLDQSDENLKYQVLLCAMKGDFLRLPPLPEGVVTGGDKENSERFWSEFSQGNQFVYKSFRLGQKIIETFHGSTSNPKFPEQLSGLLETQRLEPDAIKLGDQVSNLTDANPCLKLWIQAQIVSDSDLAQAVNLQGLPSKWIEKLRPTLINIFVDPANQLLDSDHLQAKIQANELVKFALALNQEHSLEMPEKLEILNLRITRDDQLPEAYLRSLCDYPLSDSSAKLIADHLVPLDPSEERPDHPPLINAIAIHRLSGEPNLTRLHFLNQLLTLCGRLSLSDSAQLDLLKSFNSHHLVQLQKLFEFSGEYSNKFFENVERYKEAFLASPPSPNPSAPAPSAPEVSAGQKTFLNKVFGINNEWAASALEFFLGNPPSPENFLDQLNNPKKRALLVQLGTLSQLSPAPNFSEAGLHDLLTSACISSSASPADLPKSALKALGFSKACAEVAVLPATYAFPVPIPGAAARESNDAYALRLVEHIHTHRGYFAAINASSEDEINKRIDAYTESLKALPASASTPTPAASTGSANPTYNYVGKTLLDFHRENPEVLEKLIEQNLASYSSVQPALGAIPSDKQIKNLLANCLFQHGQESVANPEVVVQAVLRAGEEPKLGFSDEYSQAEGQISGTLPSLGHIYLAEIFKFLKKNPDSLRPIQGQLPVNEDERSAFIHQKLDAIGFPLKDQKALIEEFKRRFDNSGLPKTHQSHLATLNELIKTARKNYQEFTGANPSGSSGNTYAQDWPEFVDERYREILTPLPPVPPGPAAPTSDYTARKDRLNTILKAHLTQVLKGKKPSQIATALFTDRKFQEAEAAYKALFNLLSPASAPAAAAGSSRDLVFTAAVNAYLAVPVGSGASSGASSDPDAPLKAFLWTYCCLPGEKLSNAFVEETKIRYLSHDSTGESLESEFLGLLGFARVFNQDTVASDLVWMNKAYVLAETVPAAPASASPAAASTPASTPAPDLKEEAEKEIVKLVEGFIDSKLSGSSISPEDQAILKELLVKHFTEKWLKDFDASKPGAWETLWKKTGSSNVVNELRTVLVEKSLILSVLNEAPSQTHVELSSARKKALLQEGLEQDFSDRRLSYSAGSFFWETKGLDKEAGGLRANISPESLGCRELSLKDAHQIAKNAASLIALAHPVWDREDSERKNNLEHFFFALLTPPLDIGLFLDDPEALEVLRKIENFKKTVFGLKDSDDGSKEFDPKTYEENLAKPLEERLKLLSGYLKTSASYDVMVDCGKDLAEAASRNNVSLRSQTEALGFELNTLLIKRDVFISIEGANVVDRTDSVEITRKPGTGKIELAKDGSTMEMSGGVSPDSDLARDTINYLKKHRAPHEGYIIPVTSLEANTRKGLVNLLGLIGGKPGDKSLDLKTILAPDLVKKIIKEGPGSARYAALGQYCVARIEKMSSTDQEEKALTWMKTFLGGNPDQDLLDAVKASLGAKGVCIDRTTAIGLSPISPAGTATVITPPAGHPPGRPRSLSSGSSSSGLPGSVNSARPSSPSP